MNLNDLSNFNSIGLSLSIAFNGILENIKGLIGLIKVGLDLLIRQNNTLQNINGLSILTNAGEILELPSTIIYSILMDYKI